MTRGKVWYIPGWAAPRDGSCALTRKLAAQSALDIIWLPDYGSGEWQDCRSPDLIYSPLLSRRLASEPAPVTLVGWSLGGMVAIELAAAQPCKVERLILLSTTARFRADEIRPSGPSTDQIEGMIGDPRPETIRRFLMASWSPVRPKADALKAATDAALAATPDQLRLGLTYLLRADLRGGAQRIEAPVSIAHGDRDAIVPLDAAEELAGLLPNARLHVLAEAGHLLPETNTADILAVIHR